MSKHACRRSGRLLALALLGLLLPGPGAFARETPPDQERLAKIVKRLERMADGFAEAIAAARARAPHEGSRGDRGEREIAERQIEALRLAVPALREGERRDAAELVELAIHARELALEGRRDREARAISERGPDREQIIELLVLAEDLYREFGMKERAATVSSMTEELWPKRRRARHSRERGERRRGHEREQAIHDLEVMRIARHALLEADRHDAADLLQRAIRAREVTLEGREDREAATIRDRGPRLGQQVEILQMAAGIWRELDRPGQAEAVAGLAERMWSRHRPGEDRRGREGRQRDERRDRQDHPARERSAREEGRHRERAQREEHRDRQDHPARERSAREEGRHRGRAQREEHRNRQEHRAHERSAREEGRHRERAQREDRRDRQEHRAHERSAREESRHRERREQPGGMDRIERLEMRFAELERMLKEIKQELRELKRGRRRE